MEGVPRSAVVAIGGNSLVRAGEKGLVEEQRANARRTAQGIAELMHDGRGIIVTHGNGPQVGAALLRSERSAAHVYRQPLDVCVACTQGEIGYILQQAIGEAMALAGLQPAVATVLSQVVVSADDPAMRAPSKPVGPFMSQREAEARRDEEGWHIVEDASRGWRRVVPSPLPLEIVEERVICDLVRRGVLVIALGGGGIPVVRENGWLRGIEAVIDKDRASALLAARLHVQQLIISTDTDRVYLDYKKPGQRALEYVSVEEVRRYRSEGHFPPGNMGPKIEAALSFLDAGGREVIITRFEQLVDAVHDRAGTHILP
jgi:carbamate kinase